MLLVGLNLTQVVLFTHSLVFINPFIVLVISLLLNLTFIRFTLENRRSQTQFDCGKDKTLRTNSERFWKSFSPFSSYTCRSNQKKLTLLFLYKFTVSESKYKFNFRHSSSIICICFLLSHILGNNIMKLSRVLECCGPNNC